MPSIHITVRTEPIEDCGDQQTVCGATLKNWQWLWMVSQGPKFSSHISSNVKDLYAISEVCPKCWLSNWDGNYIYALVGSDAGRSVQTL